MFDNLSSTAIRRPRLSPSEKRMATILAVVLVAVLAFGVKTGRLLFMDGLSTPSLVGTFHDEQGGKVEFLSDGNGIASATGRNLQLKWSRIDSSRISLEPQGTGLPAQVCGYRFHSYTRLAITDCALAVNLTRARSVGFW